MKSVAREHTSLQSVLSKSRDTNLQGWRLGGDLGREGDVLSRSRDTNLPGGRLGEDLGREGDVLSRSRDTNLQGGREIDQGAGIPTWGGRKREM